MRVTPKMSERPEATRNRNIALARPLRSWTRRRDMAASPHPAREKALRLAARAHLLHFFVGGQHLLAGDVLVVHHDADPALRIDLGRANPRAHRRLAIHGAEGDGPDGRLHLEPLEGSHEL